MIHLSGPLRRGLGVLALGMIPALALGPFPVLRGLVLLGLGLVALMMLVLPGLGLEEDLAWKILFTLLQPWSWMTADPGTWWLDLARGSEDPRVVRGALSRAEAWGAPDAAYEQALLHLDEGIAGFHAEGVRRLQALAAQGDPKVLAALAGCLAWGQGLPPDPGQARALWIRQGGGIEDAIPPPPPGLLRRSRAKAPGGLDHRLAEGMEGLGRATRALLSRSPLARAGLWLLTGVLALLLLSFPLALLGSQLTQGGLVGRAMALILGVVLAFAVPPLLMIAGMGFQLRRSTRMSRPARGQLLRAEQGDAEAAYRQGLDYDRGTPATPRDVAEARRWFQVAARQGHPEAALRLAELLLLGLGGPRDREGARRLLAPRAATHPEAARRLADLERHEADLR